VANSVVVFSAESDATINVIIFRKHDPVVSPTLLKKGSKNGFVDGNMIFNRSFMI
jgi:hypothetical protein